MSKFKRGLAILLLLLLLLLCPLTGGTVQVATAAPLVTAQTLQRGAPLSLKVTVVRPGTKAAKVLVTGPKAYKRVLKRTTTLKNLKPGTYKIKAQVVTTRAWRATPTVSRRKVKLNAKKRKAKSVVDYATIVSRSVRPLAPKSIAAFTSPADTGSGTLKTAAALSPGDIVASATSAKAPAGILIKVVKKTSSARGTATYTVRQATLDEAVPRGSFEQSFAADVSDPAGGSSGRRATRNSPRATVAPKALPVTCTSSKSAGIELAAQGGVDVTMGADWDFGDSSINISARPNASVSGHAWLNASGSCQLAKTLLYQRKFAPINIQLGPVPLVILPKLEMFAGGKVQASGSMDVTGRVGVEAKLTGKASRHGFKTSFSGPTFTKTAGFKSAASGSASMYGTAVVTGEVYGIAGPHASVTIGVKAAADKNANPWWTADAFGNAGLGIKVDKCVKVLFKKVCLKFDKSKEDMFKKTVRIAQASGGYGSGTDVARDVAGPGVEISDPETNSESGGTGRIGGLTDGDAWVLTTGYIDNVPGASADTLASDDRGAPGNATLSALGGFETYDATFMTMNVRPTGNRLRIKYLFATEEFPEYIDTEFNDVMGVFVNGQNCAVVPGTSTPISVNTVNDHTNSQYFVNNLDSHLGTVMNELTVPLSCTVPVTPGANYQVLIGIADSSDGVLDSAIALIDGGVSSFNQ